MDIILSPDFLLYALALAGAGALAGLLAGLFGVGGGAVMVPVLYEILLVVGVDQSIAMHIAVGTSLGIIVPTSLRSFTAHRARGAVDMKLLKAWIFAVPFGVVLASLTAALISGAALRGIFACIAILVALKLLFNRESWRLGAALPKNPVRTLCGIGIGFFSTLMGVGGGILNNTFMSLFGRPMHQAVATSSGVGVLISIPGVIGYIAAGWSSVGLPPLSLGYVNILAVLLTIPVTSLMAPLGAKIAHALERRKLEIAFGLFLLTVAARFLLTFL